MVVSVLRGRVELDEEVDPEAAIAAARMGRPHMLVAVVHEAARACLHTEEATEWPALAPAQAAALPMQSQQRTLGPRSRAKARKRLQRTDAAATTASLVGAAGAAAAAATVITMLRYPGLSERKVDGRACAKARRAVVALASAADAALYSVESTAAVCSGLGLIE